MLAEKLQERNSIFRLFSDTLLNDNYRLTANSACAFALRISGRNSPARPNLFGFATSLQNSVEPLRGDFSPYLMESPNKFKEELKMFSGTRVDQVERMASLNQFALHSGLVSKNTHTSYDLRFRKGEGSPARRPLCELLRTVGKNPKLVAALAAKNSREERIDLLTNHKLIASRFDLPSREKIKQEMKYLAACPERWDKPAAPAIGACSMLAFGGSYED